MKFAKKTYTTAVIIEHSFCCDDCGKFLFTSTEYDGYYEEPRTFNIQRVKLKGHYCDECGLKRVNDVIAYARSKNFDI